MAKKRKQKAPDRFFIPGAGWHSLRVAIINTHHEGLPKNVSLLSPGGSVDIGGGEEFMTVYVPEVMTQPKRR